MRKWISLLLLLCLLPATLAGQAAGKTAEAEAETENTAAAAGGTQAADAGLNTEELAPGYVFVQTATVQGWLPLPAEGEISFPLAQTLPDGTEALNVIHLLPNGVYMESSTCEGHDCVEQGTVTFDNIQERILSRYILCLPNQVSLELYSTEELLALMGQQEPAGAGAKTETDAETGAEQTTP